jgi:hypothetical protein
MANLLYVTLLSSENTYLTYPCEGLLQILEYGTDGSIIAAGFRVKRDISEYNGKFNSLYSAQVQVSKPTFQYEPGKSSFRHWKAATEATGIKPDYSDSPNAF